MPIDLTAIFSKIKSFISTPTPALPIQHAEVAKLPLKEGRQWRLTKYLVADQNDFPRNDSVPVYDIDGKLLMKVDPGLFSFMSLQGTCKMANGMLINVSGKTVEVKHDEYSKVLDYHLKHMSKRPFAYSGIFVKDGRVTAALTWRKIPSGLVGLGYGIQNGIPLQPFKTLAADIGRTQKSEPKFKGKGGLAPIGTKVFIKDFEGKKMPDGSTHDGWFVVNDTGGGIYGAHFDVFVGSSKLYNQVTVPGHSEVWFEGIEDKVAKDYKYGLYDK